MSPAARILGASMSEHPLRMGFLRWQCRCRQMAMRERDGRPDDAITPSLTLAGEARPLGHIITVLNKAPRHSVTAELSHMRARTNDPAQRREQAIRFLSAGYYQKPAEFSDILTATFPPGSPGAAAIRAAGEVTLRFDAYSQEFRLVCRVWKLAAQNPLCRSTLAHNALFNPTLHPETEVLGFEPDWERSHAAPEIGGR